MTIGKLIEKYRTEHGRMSQRQFANLCSLSNGCISMIEKGINPNTKQPITPTLPVLKKIASGMGMTLDALLQSVDNNQRISLVDESVIGQTLSPHEEDLILAYRAKPELQAAVDKLLDIEAEVVSAPSRTGTA